jgi:predicted nucleic acid-binding protein
VILVDAGPLVAVLHRDDRHHRACVDVVRSIREPVVTAWPVIAEAMHLLRFSWPLQDALWQMLVAEDLRVATLDGRDVAPMRALMARYRSLPMDLADAALVRLAEREGVRRIFTLDRRDFSVYRPARTGRFTILP